MHFEFRRARKMHKNENKSLDYWNLRSMNQWTQENCFGSFDLRMTVKLDLLEDHLDKLTWNRNYPGLALEVIFKNFEGNAYMITLPRISATWRGSVVKAGYIYGLWQINSRRWDKSTKTIKLWYTKTNFRRTTVKFLSVKIRMVLPKQYWKACKNNSFSEALKK